ncbi:membrane protein UL147A [Panine betaherpesvirus 2]|uniref:Membrane protein UL147A n=1 Tax=Panine betaherpesvirus 2 TaxID=188763 RepID=Q8QRX9_9BETA|nr:membrane protein UL147A [Panine betaherpesvirus 2]AAM00760.1 membrane protein UL147A [Panine betaherpesvirus 2]QXV67872.1 membrane protein UL147A [Panine betaherpesvirus 2]
MSLFYRIVALGALGALTWYTTNVIGELAEGSCVANQPLEEGDDEGYGDDPALTHEDRDYRALWAFSLVICGTLLVTCVL